MRPYSITKLGQHWFREWLVAWWHQVITWTNVDLSSRRCCGIQLMAISQEILKTSILDMSLKISNSTLQWRHNGHDSVSNHQPHDCFLNRLFRHRSKKTSKLRVTGLYTGNSPASGEFPTQMASNAENVSIWWRHHEITATSSSVQWVNKKQWYVGWFLPVDLPLFRLYCSKVRDDQSGWWEGLLWRWGWNSEKHKKMRPWLQKIGLTYFWL